MFSYRRRGIFCTPPPHHARPPSVWQMCSALGVLVAVVLVLGVLLLPPGGTSSPVHGGAAGRAVELDYATYRGRLLGGDGAITAWLGMRYAAAPTGSRRFAPPHDPPPQQGVVHAYAHGNTCLSTGRVSQRGASEDCLFIDVYAPSRPAAAAAAAASTPLLPVYFFIQGGGFNENSNANYDGSGLIEASGHSIVVVTFNYRVGVYGFLASAEVEAAASATTNNGLRDQLKALEWVQRHIAHFGGDPDHVVLGGDSAGAASIALLLTMNGSEPTRLFHGAAAESVSFAPLLTVDESQYQFDKLVERSDCAGDSNNTAAADAAAESVLSCLRGLSVVQLQQNSRAIAYPGLGAAYNAPLFMWNPVLDGDLVHDYTYRAFNTGAFQRTIPVIVGDDTDGGTIFAPRWTGTLVRGNQFLIEQFPRLASLGLFARINALYPLRGPYFAHAGRAWRRTATAYGHLRYMCPSLFIARAYARTGTPLWQYRWNVQDPRQVAEGYGVPHVVELSAIWGPANTNGAAPWSYYTVDGFPGGGKAANAKGFGVGKNAWVVPVAQRYWTQFIKHLDPNGEETSAAASSNDTNVPWDQWAAADKPDDWGRRLRFDSDPADMGMESIDDDLKERCEFWWSIGVELGQ